MGEDSMIESKVGKQINDKMVLEVIGANGPGNIKLKRKEWELVIQIDGVRTVGEIVGRFKVEKAEILAIFDNLYQKNLIKVKNHVDKVYVDKEFFTKLEQILTEYIGPVAPFVIDEMLIELNEDRSEFNTEKLPLLAEMISRTIEDDEKKIKYQSVMLEQLMKS